MDFTFKTYKQLLQTLQSSGYAFTTFADYIKKLAEPPNRKSEIANRKSAIVNPKLIILRHDVEARYQNAQQFAVIQHEMGIRGSYYFRLYKRPKNTRIIRNIADLGHEIGYHYDDLSYCKGNTDQAIIRFERHLDFLRTIAPIETITMEGAPLSSHDNRTLWEKFDYQGYGIIAEPYFDLNFGTEFKQTPGAGTRNPEPDTSTGSVTGTPNAQRPARTERVRSGGQTPDLFFYLTDTGRRWDGWRVSLRDKVPQQDEWIRQGLIYHTTHDIIRAAKEGSLPEKIMMTFHPQRWNNTLLPWLSELVSQKMKNQVKRVLVAMSK